MSEALAAVFPATTLQTCIVHLHSPQPGLRQLEGAQAARGGAAADLHGGERRGRAARRSTRLSAAPGARSFPTVVASWRRAWTHVIPFFAFPPDVRRVIYTTNALESVHAQLRKIIKTRGHFPTDEAATKLIWLALRNITAKWERGPHSLESRDESVRDSLRGSLHDRHTRKMQRAQLNPLHTRILDTPGQDYLSAQLSLQVEQPSHAPSTNCTSNFERMDARPRLTVDPAIAIPEQAPRIDGRSP